MERRSTKRTEKILLIAISICCTSTLAAQNKTMDLIKLQKNYLIGKADTLERPIISFLYPVQQFGFSYPKRKECIPASWYAEQHPAFFCRIERKMKNNWKLPIDFGVE